MTLSNGLQIYYHPTLYDEVYGCLKVPKLRRLPV